MSSFDALRTTRQNEHCDIQEIRKDSRIKDVATIGGGLLAFGGFMGYSILTMIVQAACVIIPAGIGILHLIKGDILGGLLFIFIVTPIAYLLGGWVGPWFAILAIFSVVIWGIGAVFGIALNPFAIWGTLWGILGWFFWIGAIFAVCSFIYSLLFRKK